MMFFCKLRFCGLRLVSVTGMNTLLTVSGLLEGSMLKYQIYVLRLQKLEHTLKISSEPSRVRLSK